MQSHAGIQTGPSIHWPSLSGRAQIGPLGGFNRTALSNGVEIFTVNKPDSHFLDVSLVVTAGSRDERPDQAGYAHFLEHALLHDLYFDKGPDGEIMERSKAGIRIEGDMNLETTRFSIIGGTPDTLESSVATLARMITEFNPGYEQIEKRKGVLLEEYSIKELLRKEYGGLVGFTDFEIPGFIFPDCSLGRPSNGTEESIINTTVAGLLEFMYTHYQPHRIKLFVTGRQNDNLMEIAERSFGKLQRNPLFETLPQPVYTCWEDPQNSPYLIKRTSNPHIYAELIMPGMTLDNPLYHAMQVGNFILFTTGSSRILQNLNTNHGIYSFGSDNTYYRDRGIWRIKIMANNPHKLNSAMEDIFRAIDQFVTTDGPTEDEMLSAKEDLKNQCLAFLEERTDLRSYAISEGLGHPLFRSPEERAREIKAVTAQDVRQAIEKIYRKDLVRFCATGDITEDDIKLPSSGLHRRNLSA